MTENRQKGIEYSQTPPRELALWGNTKHKRKTADRFAIQGKVVMLLGKTWLILEVRFCVNVVNGESKHVRSMVER